MLGKILQRFNNISRKHDKCFKEILENLLNFLNGFACSKS